jgi:hypothetical protein
MDTLTDEEYLRATQDTCFATRLRPDKFRDFLNRRFPTSPSVAVERHSEAGCSSRNDSLPWVSIGIIAASVL